MVLMGIVFVAAQGALGLFVWQYRERPDSKKVEYSHGNTKLEVLWTVLTAVLFVGLNLMGSNVWARERFAPAEAGSVPVEVTGMQFAWYFRYPGCGRQVWRYQSQADGSFRRQRGCGRPGHRPIPPRKTMWSPAPCTCRSIARWT